MKLQDLSIEQLRQIVDGAPDGAEYFENYTQRYLKEKDIKSDYSQNITALLAVWCDIKWSDMVLNYSESDLKHITKLSDIRAELLARDTQLGFAVGDLVVPKSNAVNSVPAVREVLEIDGAHIRACIIGIFRSYWTHNKGWRIATSEEKAVGHRIDAPTVCVEQETAELFNSKHCSPRNYNNDSALRVSEIKASAAYSKMALTNFTLSEKNSHLKTNNHALKAALAMSIVVGVVGWLL